MVTLRLEELLRAVCSAGGVSLKDVVKEAQSMGIEQDYAEEALGVLASEGFIKIKDGIVTLVKK